ncbi:MAG: DUF1365 family protein [Thermodesulfobacteriota bacterium]
MNSKIYTGYIEHTRHAPRHHRLRYPLYVYGLDLDELPALDRRLPLFGYNRFRPSAIYDRDYGCPGDESIREKLLALLEKEGVDRPVERIMLITSARYFNYVFNPVNFYYCYGTGGETVAVVAEVNNTFGERHLYVLTSQRNDTGGYALSYETAKAFHVSPFNNLEGTYHFFFSSLETGLDIKIELIRDGELVFEAKLVGKAVALTPGSHARTLLAHPVVPHLSIPRIYWQAFRLSFQRKLAYHPKPAPKSIMTIPSTKPFLLQTLCQRIVMSVLRKINQGQLQMILPDRRRRILGTEGSGPKGVIDVRDYHFFPRLVFQGDIGFGEAYVDGNWDSPDLAGLFTVLIKNRSAISDGNWLTALPLLIKERLAHIARKNSIPGSRENIYQHYDLGNDFYALFLDDSMTYSCALFQSPGDSLETAQQHKLNRIIEKARIGPDDHVLEIGCGWGGFAIEAVRQTGCRVTGITISQAQHDLAVERVRQAGLQDRIDIQLKDFRHLEGAFDRIVSIEMLEAVGEKYMAGFFQACDRLLKKGGRAVIQTITIPDQRYREYRRQRDWIQKHIFPGGHLPSLTLISSILTRKTGFTIDYLENIGPHYAITLNHWRRRFMDNEAHVRALGFDTVFIRKWFYYLAVCEAGFANRALGDLQLVLVRE